MLYGKKRVKDLGALALCNLNWLAGLLDGEGCISIRPNGNSWAYEINFTTTSRLIAQKCCSILWYEDIEFLLKFTKQRHLNINWSAKYNVRVIRIAAMAQLLHLTLPWITEKRVRAKILLALLTSKLRRKQGYHYYTKQELRLIKRFRSTQRKPYKLRQP